MLTPLPWVNPWTLAGQTAALDNLSGGRVILTVGLGAPDAGARGFPLEMDRRLRAERLDEGLDILAGLWSGEPFAYEGKHYRIDPTPFAYNAREQGMPPPPPPVQRPRITTWVVGIWPRKKSMARAVRYNGIIPGVQREDANQASPEEIEAIAAYAAERRSAGAAFDIVVEGETEPGAASDEVQAYARSGASWWIESRWALPSNAEGAEQLRQRIEGGPPQL
jgi:alkanesulfonate monooxygenase SsuD/methylene tetrahydromethanopterin reductase-like flavin-dependent oxidoreductase (luciferase family)